MSYITKQTLEYADGTKMVYDYTLLPANELPMDENTVPVEAPTEMTSPEDVSVAEEAETPEVTEVTADTSDSETLVPEEAASDVAVEPVEVPASVEETPA